METTLTVRERIQLRQLIDQSLDELYQRATQLGEEMGKLFTKANRSQLRNLETVAGAATRTSVLKNHIKNQTGKDGLRKEQYQTWARRDDGPSLGKKTLRLLDELGKHATSIAKAMRKEPIDEQSELARTVEIELQRGVVQTAVCAALYESLEGEP